MNRVYKILILSFTILLISNKTKSQHSLELEKIIDSTFDSVHISNVSPDKFTHLITNDSLSKASGLKKVTVEDLKKLQKSASQRIPEGQELTVFEASLINYFQPEYNKEYKESFPSPDFKSYEEIYNTDFDYSHVTLDTYPVASRLFSNEVLERKYVHSKHFPLESNHDKKTLFEFLIDENE
ncbi:hypothetical protein GCM10009122_49190 [Fulvivirga kasyanovii]|uniref:Helix-hairpin-helix domain-containing protein n=1 Tax=Fulvivirga kasyanovii TaxID=396812 RepID=A0ABM9P6A4_9BACT|nr:hypothetical protein [Fulvivirga kasyanovii]MTI23411.1 hypothetical protein [Fulvivirga kasyanovii]